MSWRHVYGAGWLAGMGFTMSLFIADLAFADEALLASVKVGILAASVIAGTVGYLLLRRTGASSEVSAASEPGRAVQMASDEQSQ